MMSSIPKWWQTIRIAWSKHTAYRLNFVLQILGPTLVFFFVKYNLWSAVYSTSPETVIKGYTFQEMIQYHVWALVVGLIAQGHMVVNLSEEIRMGRISAYLIYPFNFWEFHTADFLAFQTMQTLIALITIFLIGLSAFLDVPSFQLILTGMTYCLFVSLFWFTLQYMTGLMGFWLEETWMLRVTLRMIAGFLSGAILPLELYPEKLVTFLDYTPFPYLTYYPIKIFTGQFNQFGQAYLVMGLWCLVFIAINKFIWRKGIKMYTAAGM
jgi:ABC-2 type transport system permease protein